MSHTPGPWATHKTEGNGSNISDRLEIVGPEEGRKRSLIASIYGFKLPEGQANAQLIAAAPELLEVIREAVDSAEREMAKGRKASPGLATWLEKARAALAKARADEGMDGTTKSGVLGTSSRFATPSSPRPSRSIGTASLWPTLMTRASLKA